MNLSCVVIALAVGLATPVSVSAEEIRIGARDAPSPRYMTVPTLIEAYDRAGVDMALQFLPSKRVLYEFETRTVDAVVARVFSLPNRISGIVRVTPAINHAQIRVYTRFGSDVQIETPQDLAKYNVTIPRGSIIVSETTKLAKSTVPVQNYAQMLELLLAGRVDAIVGARVGVEIAVARKGFTSPLQMLDIVLADEPLYHYVDARFADEALLVSQELQKMHDSGELQKMHDAGWLKLLGDAARGT